MSFNKKWIPYDGVVNAPMAQKVYKFWEISQAWNQRPGASGITTSDAIHALNDVAAALGPHRRVLSDVLEIQDNIIIGRGTKEKARKEQQTSA